MIRLLKHQTNGKQKAIDHRTTKKEPTIDASSNSAHQRLVPFKVLWLKVTTLLLRRGSERSELLAARQPRSSRTGRVRPSSPSKVEALTSKRQRTMGLTMGGNTNTTICDIGMLY